MKKVMLLAAVVAMVLAVAVPAFAQTQVAGVEQGGHGNLNIACVQQAANSNSQAAAAQYGDAINLNEQAIAQECNINVAQVNEVAKKFLTVNKAGEVVIVKHFVKGTATATAKASATASATAKASVPAVVEYKASAPAVVEYQYKASAPAAVEYEYSASAASAPAAELPETGGSSLIALGAGVLLVAGGLLARRIVR